jgi:hypothetical protein
VAVVVIVVSDLHKNVKHKISPIRAYSLTNRNIFLGVSVVLSEDKANELSVTCKDEQLYKTLGPYTEEPQKVVRLTR